MVVVTKCLFVLCCLCICLSTAPRVTCIGNFNRIPLQETDESYVGPERDQGLQASQNSDLDACT
jgi:hypothetical protein